MPLEVKIPKEITEYREKIIFGLSVRQLFCVAIAVIICMMTFFAVKPFIGNDLAGYLVLVEAMPVMGIGFLRINGFTFEKYAMIVINHMFNQQIRVYRTRLSVDFFDYYSDFGLGVSVSDELISKVKAEKYSKVRGESTNSQDVFKQGKNKESKLKADK